MKCLHHVFLPVQLVQLQQQVAAQLAAGRESLVRALSVFQEAIMLCDLTNPMDWRICYANGAWDQLSGKHTGGRKGEPRTGPLGEPWAATEWWRHAVRVDETSKERYWGIREVLRVEDLPDECPAGALPLGPHSMLPPHLAYLVCLDCGQRAAGVPHSEALSQPFWKLVEMAPGIRPQHSMLAVQAAIAQQEPFVVWVTVKRESEGGAAKAPRVLQLTFRPATNDHLGEGIPLIGIPNFVPMTGDAKCDSVLYFATAEVRSLAQLLAG